MVSDGMVSAPDSSGLTGLNGGGRMIRWYGAARVRSVEIVSGCVSPRLIGKRSAGRKWPTLPRKSGSTVRSCARSIASNSVPSTLSIVQDGDASGCTPRRIACGARAVGSLTLKVKPVVSAAFGTISVHSSITRAAVAPCSAPTATSDTRSAGAAPDLSGRPAQTSPATTGSWATTGVSGADELSASPYSMHSDRRATPARTLAERASHVTGSSGRLASSVALEPNSAGSVPANAAVRAAATWNPAPNTTCSRVMS